MYRQDAITLYLTPEGATRNAEAYCAGTERVYRIVPGFIRDADGSTDRGFKVEIRQRGEHYRWL